MTELESLFTQEREILESICDIAQSIHEMSEYSVIKSPLELADAEIVGKRIRRACDKVNEQIHAARNKLGALLTHTTKVKLKKAERPVHEVENDLSLMHGDIEAIGRIAEDFFEAKDRKAAFYNMNKHYSELVDHVSSLMAEGPELKKLL